jgi:hypothetical protein
MLGVKASQELSLMGYEVSLPELGSLFPTTRPLLCTRCLLEAWREIGAALDAAFALRGRLRVRIVTDDWVFFACTASERSSSLLNTQIGAFRLRFGARYSTVHPPAYQALGW